LPLICSGAVSGIIPGQVLCISIRDLYVPGNPPKDRGEGRGSRVEGDPYPLTPIPSTLTQRALRMSWLCRAGTWCSCGL
jgi:hypothetical protein